MSEGIREPRVLAVAPCVYGIGYVVFNGPWLPLDWGIKWTKSDKNTKGIAKLGELIERYRPDVLVFEDHGGEGSRRSKRVGHLLDGLAELARDRQTETRRYSRARIREAFASYGAVTKHEIAKAVVTEFPDFAPRLPVKRKIWLPEHPNMSIFDAASLALTYFSSMPSAPNVAQAPSAMSAFAR